MAVGVGLVTSVVGGQIPYALLHLQATPPANARKPRPLSGYSIYLTTAARNLTPFTLSS